MQAQVDRDGNKQFDRVLPFDELGEIEWNSNYYLVVQGGDGRLVQGVWHWLLPYWAMRYYGAIE